MRCLVNNEAAEFLEILVDTYFRTHGSKNYHIIKEFIDGISELPSADKPNLPQDTGVETSE